MKDMKFVIYDYGCVALDAEIEDGKLTLVSNVFGEYDSEKTYSFSKEGTEKLFSIISIDDFVSLCRKENLMGMEKFLERNDIKYASFTWVN